MSPAWLLGAPVGAVAVLCVTAGESNALILGVVSMLFFRAFRDRSLLTWGMGWVAYGVFLWVARNGELHGASPATVAFGQAEFGLALGLFAAAILISTHARRWLTALLLASVAVVALASLRPLYFPHSTALRMALEGCYRLIAAGAVLQLLRYRSGRIGLGTTLLTAGLLTLNLNWPPLTGQIPREALLVAEALFGYRIVLLGLE